MVRKKRQINTSLLDSVTADMLGGVSLGGGGAASDSLDPLDALAGFAAKPSSRSSFDSLASASPPLGAPRVAANASNVSVNSIGSAGGGLDDLMGPFCVACSSTMPHTLQYSAPNVPVVMRVAPW